MVGFASFEVQLFLFVLFSRLCQLSKQKNNYVREKIWTAGRRLHITGYWVLLSREIHKYYTYQTLQNAWTRYIILSYTTCNTEYNCLGINHFVDPCDWVIHMRTEWILYIGNNISDKLIIISVDVSSTIAESFVFNSGVSRI